MSMKRYQSGKTDPVAIIILVILIGVGWVYVPRFLRQNAYVKDRNHCRNLFSSKKWEASIEAYQKLWKDFPEHAQKDKDKVFQAYCQRGDEFYNRAITKGTGPRAKKEDAAAARADYSQAIPFYEKAQNYGELDARTLFNLVDACVESGNIAKAKAVVEKAKQRSGLDARKLQLMIRRVKH